MASDPDPRIPAGPTPEPSAIAPIGEAAYPVVTARRRGRSVFIDVPTNPGNATDEEKSWPVAPAEGTVLVRG